MAHEPDEQAPENAEHAAGGTEEAPPSFADAMAVAARRSGLGHVAPGEAPTAKALLAGSAKQPLAALQLGSAILQISTLGFLGYGAPPPTPEWGLLIAEGRNYVATAWWLTVLPGAVVVLVVLATNRLSQAIGRKDAA